MEKKAKPFVKWAGGKGGLLSQIDNWMPMDWQLNVSKPDEVTYVEPFVGGGAILFFVLQRYPNFKRVIINDINVDLIGCYRVVRNEPEELIKALRDVQGRYYSMATSKEREALFLEAREVYNSAQLSAVEKTCLFIFLNRTCFNGLYRVNRSGAFDVPFGKYTKPLICDEKTIRVDSQLLQRVEIMAGDFSLTIDEIKGPSFFYLDPPYYPISKTSAFTSYSKEGFGKDEQIRLKSFCDKVRQKGGLIMQSNSYCPFITELYEGYEIRKVWATRAINSDPTKRGKVREVIIMNFDLW